MEIKKSITERDLVAFLREKLRFPPLQVADVQVPVFPPSGEERREVDALLTLRWGEKSFRFAVEAKSRWTPKVISAAADEARTSASLMGAYPLVLVPYLGAEWVRTLEVQNVSGLDLCGNGIVIVPGELLVQRTGQPNQFRWTGTIKNVYRKNSSIVARFFLLVAQLDSVKAALTEIRKRGGDITIGTVSKVCTSLEDDLVIERDRADAGVARRLRLLQADKLLDLLARNYAPPEVRRTFRGKCDLSPQALREKLFGIEKDAGIKIVLTGTSAVDSYAVMAREPVQSFYCTDIGRVVAGLGSDFRETERFANVIFQEAHDAFVYFDRRPGLVASPIQVYLELARGDQREKETAEQVRRVILGGLDEKSSGEG
jgi:hypothetical protein